uniref:Lipoxygenase n=1 Tax=Kalanchoe fedtschenkoi TaxID=63787 RepID=A0A7N0R9W0_KALFE
MIERLLSCITCNCIPSENGRGRKIQGRVVLMKKNVLDFNDFVASAVDRLGEVFRQRVSLQLISKVNAADGDINGGKIGKAVYLEDWITSSPALAAGESHFKVTFDWDEEVGVPGAILIKNDHHYEFYLKTITLENVPSHGRIHFVCNSWVYPVEKYNYDRVFFANQAYLPSETPLPLLKYRAQELENLRGNGTEKFEEHDRVYEYALYNDLGNPDKGPDHARQTLGGSPDFPYPRRGKTGRKPTKKDPTAESRLSIVKSLGVYVPRDERFGHLKMSDFLAYAFKSITQVIQPELEALFDDTLNEFDSFQDVLDIYEGGIKLPGSDKISKLIPFEFLKELFRTDGAGLLKYPMPAVIRADRSAWRTDFEFGREMLAGVNPVCISRLEEFPPASKLDRNVYGDQSSKITREHIEDKLEGLTIEEALEKNRLYILNHHDSLLPYVRRINDNTSRKLYATRTILFLEETGTLKPLAIELSVPHPDGDALGAVSKVFTPADEGVEGALWQLAKAYAAVNDSGVHQLISHW